MISWAAPIAAPYYTATPSEPEGLVLRRRLQTDYDRLIGLSDEVFGERASIRAGTDVMAALPEAAEPTLDDLLLKELSRERTGAMREIVATIQRDQYRIITAPADSTTVVQGAPGTGKTVVGLHRAALLLYRNRNASASPRFLIVGPNLLFIRYLSYVLPSLGETAADQVAVTELGPVEARVTGDGYVAHVKGSPAMAQVIANAVDDRIRVPNADITLALGGREVKVEVEAIAEAVEAAKTSSSSYSAGREMFRAALERLAL